MTYYLLVMWLLTFVGAMLIWRRARHFRDDAARHHATLTAERATSLREQLTTRSRMAAWREGLIEILATDGRYDRSALRTRPFAELIDMTEASFRNAASTVTHANRRKIEVCNENMRLLAQRAKIRTELERLVALDPDAGALYPPGRLIDGIRTVIATMHNHERIESESTP